ncbi:MAG: hypothetical protein AAB472_01175 [Patescibacteria group bacterium]
MVKPHMPSKKTVGVALIGAVAIGGLAVAASKKRAANKANDRSENQAGA